jgi:predicted GH43/DUF377 family glycosyl hydrolase
VTALPARGWVRRSDVLLEPDPARVVATIFLPGQELAAPGQSRSTAVLDRVLAMSEDDVSVELESLLSSFGARHRDVAGIWASHFRSVEHRVLSHEPLTTARRHLIGAYFTQEYALEGAALFNPSMVPHPDQAGLPEGSVRFVMSVRAVGEGHLSSIELRTGVVDADQRVTLDEPADVAVLPTPVPVAWSRTAFAHQLVDIGGERTNSDFVLGELPETFHRGELDEALQSLRDQRLTRGAAVRTIDRFEWIAACSYAVEFPESSAAQERVLMPRGPSETNGMEDLRLVRVRAEDGHDEYLGTYTAYDGRGVSSQLLATSDFRRFTVSRLSGPGARNKGLALFPRRIGDRYVALSRTDRESNGITTSADLLHWDEPVLVQTPHEPWEIVQLGNCGPPIETERGWLVLTHGVGPMREYSIGALLLDLDDPTVVLGRLRTPLLAPEPHERSGYVPNVVYSCGAMLHGRSLVLPYGCNDATTRVAVVLLDPLLDELHTSSDDRSAETYPETT